MADQGRAGHDENGDNVRVNAHLFDRRGEIVRVVAIDGDPPDSLTHRGRRFERAGSSARLDDDGVTLLGLDYLEADRG